LRLGDNAVVNFERSLIFLTSNLGARGMLRELRPVFGFEAGVPRERASVDRKLAKIGMEAVKRKFSPEFVNRIDHVITYRPLDEDSLSRILDRHISDFQRHVNSRLGPDGFGIEVPSETRRFLLRKGTSAEYGARELKRTLHRHLTQPLAALVAGGRIEPGSSVRIEIDEDEDDVFIRY
jgi:ATP-dependent Clp protease ATP-binding subunit ClpA